ncbi:hypothetical protein UO65_3124 [Actinokineospora spheciospongiae]|uniref:Uncharacterized protein n=1 Tax=Actinokineospora spheciospongiae TaxID=909613 RepID=W7IMM1_9PSEU|nr:hypothetical protein [Actinokineospora spheciospongiae]EWC61603.1 hypothetical protein UO65_3124 [Actinokineospora spheciospongiae]PWW54916.1 hypothetical protein DFQ13_113110 [Actinokineospora spheciospongiae]
MSAGWWTVTAVVPLLSGAVGARCLLRWRARRARARFRLVLDEVTLEISALADELASVPRRCNGIVAEQRRRSALAYAEAARLLDAARHPLDLTEACALIRDSRDDLRMVREGA